MKKLCFVGNLSQSFVKNDYDILSKNFNVEVVDFPRGKIGWFGYLSKVKNVVKSSDLIFCWFACFPSALAIYYAKKYNKKSVVVVGGYDVACVPEIKYGAFSNLKERLPAKYVLKNADLLLPVSKFTENEVIKQVLPKKMKVIYNGVDINKFKLNNTKRNNNVVITVCGIKWSNIERKGLGLFVEVAHLLPDIKFYVIGKFIDSSIKYLKSFAPSNVVFTGYVSDKTLINWYNNASVICQLSYYEAFGLTPAEGMACGCIPIVTTKRTGMAEFVNSLGYYVPFDNKNVIAKNIKNALNSSLIYNIKLREAIVNTFSLNKRKKELIKIIKEMENEI